jgi:hypothetical protein
MRSFVALSTDVLISRPMSQSLISVLLDMTTSEYAISTPVTVAAFATGLTGNDGPSCCRSDGDTGSTAATEKKLDIVLWRFWF